MKAGDLRHRVTIETATYVDRAAGGQDRTWGAGVSMWARVRALSSAEATLLQAVQGITMFEVTVRYRAGLTPHSRITLSDGRVLEATGVVVDPKKQWVTMPARQERLAATP